MAACPAWYIRSRFGIAGLSAKNESSGRAGVLPSSTSALSPRSFTQSGSPTGATAASPSSAPRSTIVSRRGSRPSARASFGKCAQANSVPEASRSSRRDGAWRFIGMASPPLEFRRHHQQRQRLLAALGLAYGLSRFRRCERAERGFEHHLGIDTILHPLRIEVGDVEALGEPIDPGCLVIGEALRRRRPPQRLAELSLRANHTDRIAPHAGRAPHRHDPLARTFELAARFGPRF